LYFEESLHFDGDCWYFDFPVLLAALCRWCWILLTKVFHQFK